ncbi:MAG: LysE family transporter [Marinobacter sp.]|uniref:LysE family translocator n=1 Tax=Marinobacter sp. TaxID=50741 RepID=UPI0034A006E0
MIEIFAYAIGVMYTPGPVNLLGLNSGLNGHFRASLGFFIGVGSAMLILFLLFGWAGAALIGDRGLIVISALGCLYIAYLAVRIIRASVTVDHRKESMPALRFRDGLTMQLMNPKGIVATLPIATIQFPGAGIHGVSLVAWSLVLAILAGGAPGSYSLMGDMAGKRIRDPRFFKWFNCAMATLLLYVAGSIGYEFVYQPLS